MPDLPISAVGVPWYSEQNYPRILEVMTDAHVLPRTYAAWHAKAEQLIQHLKRQGAVPIKTDIDPDAFVAWCRSRGLNIDAGARTQFAAGVAKEVVAGSHGQA